VNNNENNDNYENSNERMRGGRCAFSLNAIYQQLGRGLGTCKAGREGAPVFMLRSGTCSAIASSDLGSHDCGFLKHDSKF